MWYKRAMAYVVQEGDGICGTRGRWHMCKVSV